jgi:hypothetical protein
VLKTLTTLFAVGYLLTGCASYGHAGFAGVSGYLQFVVNDQPVFEYAVPGGGMNCGKNAWFNNKESKDKTNGEYRCTVTPATEAQLPYSYVAISTLGWIDGYYESNATTTRWANSESCWAAVERLQLTREKLVSEKCGPNRTKV